MFFKKRRFIANVREVEKSLVTILGKQFPLLLENQKNWKLSAAYYFDHQEKFIQLLHENITRKNLDFNENRIPQNFRISGLKIYNEKTNRRIKVKLVVFKNLISKIYLDIDNNPFKMLDLKNIDIDHLKVEFSEGDNNLTEKKVRRILKDLNHKKKDLLGLRDTFEIEFKEKILYVILDMQDGNYITIDENCAVYRIIHDHTEPVKQISPDIILFLNSYSGNKNDLKGYFDY
ncbi:hypothetical protein [Leeuwenhoekiella sp. H156]|uniref:hypothetical protein n=1 Tax=Leeuwenhoekiella sp. H156 TaxID=3450128 RepID=UPI003FA49334